MILRHKKENRRTAPHMPHIYVHIYIYVSCLLKQCLSCVCIGVCLCLSVFIWVYWHGSLCVSSSTFVLAVGPRRPYILCISCNPARMMRVRRCGHCKTRRGRWHSHSPQGVTWFGRDRISICASVCVSVYVILRVVNFIVLICAPLSQYNKTNIVVEFGFLIKVYISP